MSDQMSSYFTVLRRTSYHKVAFEALFGTAVVNAQYLYMEYPGEEVQICQS